MQLKVLWTTLVRRWYLVLVALACTVAATLFVVVKVGPTYEAQGSVLVLPPFATVQRQTTPEAQANPYLFLNGVIQARNIVNGELMSQSVQDELAQQYPGSSFAATADGSNSAPVVLITVEADSAATATSALTAVINRVPETLVKLQSGFNLPADAVITSMPLITDSQPEAVRKGQIRSGIVAAFGAIGISLLLIGLIDGLLARRRVATPSRSRRALKAPHESDHSAIPVSAARRAEEGAHRLELGSPEIPAASQAEFGHHAPIRAAPKSAFLRPRNVSEPDMQADQAKVAGG